MTLKYGRTYARITGFSLILMACIAAFAFGYAIPEILHTSDLQIEEINLYLLIYLLISFSGIILLDILVSYTLFKYFEQANRSIAALSCVLRILYVFILAFAIYQLLPNTSDVDDQHIHFNNYKHFTYLFSIGLIIFGAHLILIGILMKKHFVIPNILAYMTMVAGVMYLGVHSIKTIIPQSINTMNELEMYLALPMACGELGLAIWVIIKG